MSFTKSRFFFVALCVAIILTVFPAVLSVMGLGNVVRQAVQTVAYPFTYCASKISDGIEGFAAYFTEYDRLREENEVLREELRKQQDAAVENEVLREENHWLRRFLDMKNEHMDYSLLDASVIARETTSYAAVLTVDRGSLHGVREGMAAVTPNGVFGYVIEVSPFSSKIVSIVETAVSVGAYTQRTGVTGLLSGDYLLRQSGKVQMTKISPDADIKVGDYVYTSGTGSVYPRGLLIGRVESVSADPYSRTLCAVILPAEDFLTVDTVSALMIITDYQVYSAEESTSSAIPSDTPTG